MKSHRIIIITALSAALALGAASCSGSESEGAVDLGNVQPDDPARPGDPSQQEGAKVRSFFPETLLSAPFVETDMRGRVSMDIELADSITTWRATAVANSLDGKYGASTFGIKVFQPFFVDFNLPVNVTRGDVLEIPLVVYNFQDEAQTVRVELEAEEGLRLLGSASHNVEVEGGEVKAVKIPVEAMDVGEFKLTANARSGDVSDAVRRPLKVVPDGKRVEVVHSGILASSNVIPIEIPANTVEGSEKLLVKIYPGKASLSSEGAADILRHPSGCFEQTTASSWPNVMALMALANDPDADPDVVERAYALVNEGYQRVLTFQHAGGGFSWWGGSDEPGLAVSALGLMQLVDTALVHPVDEIVIRSTAGWLAEHQEGDGSFESDTHLHSGNMSIGASRLRMTAYIAWALASAGLEPEAVEAALGYVKSQASSIDDAYTLSIAVMALDESGLDPDLKENLAGRLREIQGEDGSIDSEFPTMYYSYGNQALAENTAVGGLAFLADGRFTPAGSAASWIAESRQGSWGFGNTQTTVQSLRLLNTISLGPAVNEDLTVSIHYDGRFFADETITVESADVMRQFDLSNLLEKGDHTLDIAAERESNFMYEVILVYHMPWSMVDDPETHLRLDVNYDRTFLNVGDDVTVTARLSTELSDNMPMVELGLPPGFAMDSDLLNEAKESGMITRYELKSGKLALYFDEILAGEPKTVTFKLKAAMAINAVAPASMAYPYYNPGLKYETPSFPISVAE